MKERIIVASIEKLRVHAQNQATSKISFKTVERLMESMKVAGFDTAHPILVMPDPDNADFFLILDGRHRYLAAQGLGLAELPVLVSSPVSPSEQMTAITATNTIVNAVHRQLPKAKRVINVYRLLEIQPQQQESPWSLARVNKTDWYRAKNLLDKAVKEAKKAMPKADVGEIVQCMILDLKVSPKIYDLYHREDAWREFFGSVQNSREQASSSLAAESLPMAIDALSNYLRDRLQSEKLILKDTDVKSLLLLAKTEAKDSQKGKAILGQLCEVVAEALRYDTEGGAPGPGAPF